jgi:hypothetical protein
VNVNRDFKKVRRRPSWCRKAESSQGRMEEDVESDKFRDERARRRLKVQI